MTRRANRPGSAAPNRTVIWVSCWFVACLVLGGASNGGVLANLVLQLGAALIIAHSIARSGSGERQPAERFLLYLAGSLLAWIAVTLIPLPPGLWTHLPGREFVAQGYRLLGMDLPWLPISLTDDRTVRSALGLLVPIASYLAARQLDEAGVRRVATIMVLIACGSVLLGLAQLLGGESSPLRLYAITNRSDPVGLFANANHFTTFLLVAMPLAMAGLQRAQATRGRSTLSKYARYLGYGAAAICALGVLSIGSNAGRLLLIPALVGAILLGPGQALLERRQTGRLVALGLAAFGGLMVLSLTSGVMADKVGTSAKSRTVMSATTLSAARKFLPVGSGLGSFPAIYLMESGGKRSNREWTNHAHDDPAEVALELWLPGLALMAVFAGWLFVNTARVWGEPGRRWRLPQAAALGSMLVVIHSIVDYPLRSAAIAAVFGFMLAAMLQPRTRPDQAGAP